ncbi:30S ribosomal protein S18, partial [Frankliniella fusca]
VFLQICGAVGRLLRAKARNVRYRSSGCGTGSTASASAPKWKQRNPSIWRPNTQRLGPIPSGYGRLLPRPATDASHHRLKVSSKGRRSRQASRHTQVPHDAVSITNLPFIFRNILCYL